MVLETNSELGESNYTAPLRKWTRRKKRGVTKHLSLGAVAGF